MLLRILFLILTGFWFFPQEKDNFSAEITTWYQDKKGAVSISFDDAGYTQYIYAFPILEKFRLKATFSLVGEWTHQNPTYSAEPGNFSIKKMGWEQIKELHNNGHEISAHGYQHQRYKKFSTIPVLASKMKKIKYLIEKKINSPVYTIHYPYSFTSDSITGAAKSAGFLFGRTGEMNNISVNPKTPEDFYLLVSNPILNNSTPNIKEFKQWIKNVNENWLILMYHNLFPKKSKEMAILNYHHVKNTYSLFPKTFKKQMKIIAKSEFWVAPIAVVGKYITERENTTVNINTSYNTMIIKLKTSIDTSIYDYPLTLKVNLPWKNVMVKGSTNDRKYKIKKHQLLLNVLPNKEITIIKN